MLTMFTALLLIRGCPEDKIDAAWEILRKLKPSSKPSGVIAQFDDVIARVR